MFVRFRRQLSALALAVVAGACGSDSSTGPSVTTQPATLDQALAELTIPALSAAGAAFGDITPSAPALGTGRCPYVAAVQSFVCTPISASGVTVDQSFTLLSASGARQSAFDATTAAVRANTTMKGTVNDDGTNFTIDGQQELTLSGLVSGPHTLNGTSTTKLKGTIVDGTTSLPLDLTVGTTITNLVLPANATPGSSIWPASGSVVVQVSGSVSGFPTGTTKVTMTFTGGSTVNVTVTGPGVSQSCKVDLSKADPVCA
jgi:hypothetical protein